MADGGVYSRAPIVLTADGEVPPPAVEHGVILNISEEQARVFGEVAALAAQDAVSSS
jgi:hypothetical protein